MKELKNWIQKWWKKKNKNKMKPKQKTTWSLLQYSIYSTWNLSALSMNLGEMGNEMNLLTRSSDSSIQ